MKSGTPRQKPPIPLGNKRMHSAIRRANSLTREYGALVRQIRETPLSEDLRSARETKTRLSQLGISGKEGAPEYARKLIMVETEYEQKKSGIINEAKGCLKRLDEEENRLEGRAKTSPSLKRVWITAGIAGIVTACTAGGLGLEMGNILTVSAGIAAISGVICGGIGGLIGLSLRKGERGACEHIEEDHEGRISGLFEKWQEAIMEFEKKAGEIVAECKKMLP
ncbi:hypothetical protein GF415_02900 [Candidatus Micrarchaeota archaeon]|nr:hypothetical protein [Candidatus Micrarchaeota archaeon]